MADLTAWRALVEKELAGASFDKLVQRTPEGLALAPLYTERPEDLPRPGAAPFVRGAAPGAFQLCMRVDATTDPAAELAQGADALWCGANDKAAIAVGLAHGKTVVIDGALHAVDAGAGTAWSSCEVDGAHDGHSRCLKISTLAFHDAGADAADELALALATLVGTLRRLDAQGVSIAAAEPLLWAQVAIGRDTFGELCKLRALRLLWNKVMTAAGGEGRLDAIHAVCSSRTLSQRDPWVNMLRVTTQVFAAALGGAQLVTPLPFDAGFAERSPLGQRVARNTGLVLREESQLGRVLDAGGGSYYIESRTDALAREAWSRFQQIERDGGISALRESGALDARLAKAWTERQAAIAKRREVVLGVTEFANLTETLPGAPIGGVARREAEAFEALRTRVERAPREVALIQLGPPAEHRARSGFAEGMFAVAGVVAQPQPVGPVAIACICGSDERYATEAAATARALHEAGAQRIVLAGRPNALEAELRAAGVDAFIFVGCDVLATLEDLFA